MQVGKDMCLEPSTGNLQAEMQQERATMELISGFLTAMMVMELGLWSGV